MDREYILMVLLIFGTIAMYFKPLVAVVFIVLSVCVGLSTYCCLDKDSKWDMKSGGIGSRKMD